MNLRGVLRPCAPWSVPQEFIFTCLRILRFHPMSALSAYLFSARSSVPGIGISSGNRQSRSLACFNCRMLYWGSEIRVLKELYMDATREYE